MHLLNFLEHKNIFVVKGGGGNISNLYMYKFFLGTSFLKLLPKNHWKLLAN